MVKRQVTAAFTGMAKALLGLLLAAGLCGCQGNLASQIIANSSPRDYTAAGFDNADDVSAYAKQYRYLAHKLSGAEWKAFYARFPEYRKDVQDAKSDVDPGDAAYAFRWAMMGRKAGWDGATVFRLDSKIVNVGDDVYQLIYALGAPDRVLFDNDFEILIYKNGRAFRIDANACESTLVCTGCAEKQMRDNRAFLHTDDEILGIMKFARPM